MNHGVEPETDSARQKAKRLQDAARRAMAEAERRRQASGSGARPVEQGGRDGPEPTRFGDWEKNGIISDF
ncbi:MAG: DUF1674 domain-containing protein [Paracoccaceae bacterium]|nr:DUF1674 domain-containing protein [Paracoccaceae bacterium]MDE2912392.1 DUF1674 domain-containing protein [Paracoccaceae bacterium]